MILCNDCVMKVKLRNCSNYFDIFQFNFLLFITSKLYELFWYISFKLFVIYYSIFLKSQSNSHPRELHAVNVFHCNCYPQKLDNALSLKFVPRTALGVFGRWGSSSVTARHFMLLSATYSEFVFSVLSAALSYLLLQVMLHHAMSRILNCGPPCLLRSIARGENILLFLCL